MTLGQEMRWAYSTMLSSPHGVNVPTGQIPTDNGVSHWLNKTAYPATIVVHYVEVGRSKSSHTDMYDVRILMGQTSAHKLQCCNKNRFYSDYRLTVTAVLSISCH